MIEYLVESAFLATVFYFIYWIFLRKESAYSFRRYFLIGSLLISLVIPTLTIPVSWPTVLSPKQSSEMDMMDTVKVGGGSHLNGGWQVDLESILPYGLGIGAILMLSIMIYSFFRIIQMKNKSEKKIVFDRQVWFEPTLDSSFSFFGLIFTSDLNPTVIKHEVAHSRLLHSLDILVLSIYRIIFWWSPVSWVQLREMRMIHEYQADQAVLTEVEGTAYKKLLINASMASLGWNLASSFREGILIKRLNEMKKQTQKIRLWKMSVLGTLVAAISLYSCMEKELIEIAENTYESNDISDQATLKLVELQELDPDGKFKVVDMLHESEEDFAVLKHRISELQEMGDVVQFVNKDKGEGVVELILKEGSQLHEISAAVKTAEDVYTIVDRVPEFEGGMDGLGKYISENLKYPEEAKKAGIEGRVVVQFIVQKDGSVTEVTPLKGIEHNCDKEAVKVMMKSPKWTPGILDGKKVKVKMVLPIVFSIN